MRFNAEIEEKILQQIRTEPEREVILPAWAYASGEVQPVVYVKGKPVRLVRVLYQKLIGPLPATAGLAMLPGHDRRNVNPHHFQPVATRHTRVTCPNGHEYTEEDMTPRGNRCRRCREAKNLGTPNPIQLNAAKTHCPMNHPLIGDNLVKLKSGKRRCKTCHADQSRARRARQKETNS